MSIYRRHRASGFTLVEIMIVVAIIALIAAIAIPNLLRARHNANEGAAIGNMHTVVAAVEQFRSASAPTAYPANWNALATANPAYLDPVFQTGTKQGYTFTYALVNANQYTLNANPVTANVTGTRGFFADESGVIRSSAVAPADVTSPPLG